MSTADASAAADYGGARRVPPVVSDALALAWRGLLTYRRVPQLLVFSTIQPVVFVLLFTYVFGGAIHVPGVDYVDYLMPGIFVQPLYSVRSRPPSDLPPTCKADFSKDSSRSRWHARRC
jgi:hypothetical protein